MTTEAKPEVIRTFTGTVLTRAEGDNGFIIEADLPKLSKQFPTKINRVPKADADKLVPGENCSLILVKGALKQKKDGTTQSGQYDNHFFWNYRGLAPTGSGRGVEDAPRSDGVASPPSPDGFGAGDNGTKRRSSTDESIQRQVALKAAVETVTQGLEVDHVLGIAAQYAAWIGKTDALALASVEAMTLRSDHAETPSSPPASVSASPGVITPSNPPNPSGQAPTPTDRIRETYKDLDWPPEKAKAFSVATARKVAGTPAGAPAPKWGGLTPDQQEAMAQEIEEMRNHD